MKEIRFHGSGGHGIVVAAKLLADAAAKAGYHAQSFASYGALRRGGMVESYVRINNERISPHCKIYEADLTILMDDQFVQNREIVSGVKPGSQVLINSRAPAKTFPMLGQARVTTVDAGGIARNNELTLSSGLPIMNTVILGAVLAMLADIGMEHLAVAIQEAGIPAADKNIRAARQAYESVKTQKAAGSLPELSARQALRASEERHPVYCEKRSPCEVNCPAGEPIRSYISHIQQGQVKEALEAIQQENPFPGLCGRVCFHPCESQCNRKEFDQAVSINALERAAFDLASRGPAREAVQRERTGKKVGIIGAGPAGLSCAYFLTLLGHHATVFESQPVAGGIPRVAIPSYRLPKDVIDSEINRMIAMGVEVKRNTEVGKDIPLEHVMKQNDACFIATGAHASVKLAIPGEETPGVVSGLDFLRDVAFDRAKSLKRRHVVVIGGGNTAVDAARTARRLGAKEVSIVYRRSVEEMPAYAEGREVAEREGVTILPFAAPVHIHGDGKKVAGVECLKTQPVQDPQRVRPVPKLVNGTNFTVNATRVIVATGETPALEFLQASIEMDGSVIKTDYLGRTSLVGVFAGGDAASLSRSVADAIGSGKRAAIGIDLFLNSNGDWSLMGVTAAAPRGLSMRRYLADEQNDEDAPIAAFGDLNPAYFIEEPRRKRPELLVSERVRTFVEVRSGLSNNEAIQEAARCFQCGRCTLCENCYIFCSDVAISLELAPHAPVVTKTLCEGCGVCIHECPRGALSWERKEHG
ncbi:MAG: NAD(P)-binding protein [Syntrophorhabdales bacterium]|jgi:2-oxoacid:acceptor oxidoreductase gamma subunit (pyruvate/2-ketoisovalerate family)